MECKNARHELGRRRRGADSLATTPILGFSFEPRLRNSPQGKSGVFKWAHIMLYFLLKMYVLISKQYKRSWDSDTEPDSLVYCTL